MKRALVALTASLALGAALLAGTSTSTGAQDSTVSVYAVHGIPQSLFDVLGAPTTEVDVWSTGVIMYIFLTGHPPFETDNLEKTYKRIKEGDFAIPNSMNKDAADLLRRMLVVDPAKRATFEQVLSHPFMNPQLRQWGRYLLKDTRRAHRGNIHAIGQNHSLYQLLPRNTPYSLNKTRADVFALAVDSKNAISTVGL